MRFAVVTSLFFSFGTLLAQDMGEQMAADDTIRDYYIEHFPDYFFLYPVLKQRSLNFELEKEGNNGALVTFKPNNTYSFGLGMYLFELNFELAFAVPLDEQSIVRYGESDARDVQLNVLGKKFGVDAFYQKYSGFYVTERGVDISAGDPFPQRADIISRNIGLTGSYVFNNKRFSFRSAYNFAERQRYSKGSALLFGSLSTFRISADSAIITDAQEQVFGANAAFTKLRYTTFSVAPGYTYTIVFKNFFINGTFSVGPAHHWISYTTEADIDRHETTVNSFVAARISLGYNGERLFGGIGFLTQGSNVKFEDVRFSNNNGSFKILLGYRFNEFGVLKKRFWEFIPFKI